MLGYVFMVENTATNKKYIGKKLSVTFDPEYFGDNETLLNDVIRYGKNKFRTTMLSACDDPKYVDSVYRAFLTEYNAIEDSSFYNSEGSSDIEKSVEVKPRRRKKRDE